MEYEVLRQNDDGTAQVRMTIDGHVLEQAFDPAKLDENVKNGMAVFKAELDRRAPQSTVDITALIGKVQRVDALPDISLSLKEDIINKSKEN